VVGAIGPIISGILIAAVGWYFTSTYNQQQVQLAQIDAIQKLSPKLSEGTDAQRLAALAAVLSLDSENLAVRTAGSLAPDDRTKMLSSLFYNALSSKDYELVGRILRVLPPNSLAEDSLHETPLQFAVKNGDVQTLDFLLNKGFQIDDAGSSGLTPLVVAAGAGKTDVVLILLRHGAHAAPADNRNRSPLLAAIAAGKVETLRVLLSSSGGANVQFREDGRDALLTVIKESSFFEAKDYPAAEMVKILLSAGADPNTSLKPDGLTAICEAVERDYDEVAKELFEAHATFTCGAVEMTPLHSAVHLNRVGLVKFFLTKGVSPDLKESFGIVPLQEANGPYVVEALINAKANVNAKDDNGQTVLDAILQCCDLMAGTPAQRLQARRSFDAQIAKSVALLVGAGANVKEVSQYGHRPLEVAAARYSPSVLEPLVKAGADVIRSLQQTGEASSAWDSGSANRGAQRTVLSNRGEVSSRELGAPTLAL
jgi:ankyrin repeat protein